MCNSNFQVGSGFVLIILGLQHTIIHISDSVTFKNFYRIFFFFLSVCREVEQGDIRVRIGYYIGWRVASFSRSWSLMATSSLDGWSVTFGTAVLGGAHLLMPLIDVPNVAGRPWKGHCTNRYCSVRKWPSIRHLRARYKTAANCSRSITLQEM